MSFWQGLRSASTFAPKTETTTATKTGRKIVKYSSLSLPKQTAILVEISRCSFDRMKRRLKDNTDKQQTSISTCKVRKSHHGASVYVSFVLRRSLLLSSTSKRSNFENWMKYQRRDFSNTKKKNYRNEIKPKRTVKIHRANDLVVRATRTAAGRNPRI
jgi:hypothetical protein